MKARSRRYVLLDRDGTLIVHRPYLSRASEVEFLPRAIEGLRKFDELGFGVVIVTNQSGIGRGFFGWREVEAVHESIRATVARCGIRLGGFYVCPHVPEAGCDCRKPRTGLARQAAHDLDFDLADSVIIGDNRCDVEFGAALGVTTVLVRTGYGSALLEQGIASQAHIQVAADLAEAAALVAKDPCADKGRMPA